MATPWEKYATHPVVDRIINVESGGNPQARNANSSAAGPGQFIDSTWQQFITERHPQRLASGEDIFALKTDPNLGREATDWYAKKNQSFLQSKGLPTDPGAVYLAHFAGPAGAENLFRASPEASAADVLGREAIVANPHLAGMTAGDVQNWARGKMGAGGETQVAGPWVKYGGQSAAPLQGELFETPEAAPGPWTKYSAPSGAVPDAGAPAAPRQEPGMGGDVPVPAAPAGEAGVGGPAPPVVEAEQPGLFDFFTKSVLSAKSRNTLTGVLTGQTDIPTAATEFAEIAKQRDALEEHPEYVKALRALKARELGQAPQYEGALGAVRFLYDHPRWAAESIGESVIPSAESLAGSAVGYAGGALLGAPFGPPGIAIGGAIGGGVGAGVPSGFTEGMGKYLEVLQEAGIDITNEESLAGAFTNEALLAEAKDKAIKKGLPVAFFDGATAYLGFRGVGKPLAEAVFGPVSKTVGGQVVKKTTTRQAIEEGAANLVFLEAPGGMLGEGVGEYASEGEVDWVNVMLEGAGELAFSGPQVAVEVAAARMGREAPPATEKQIKDVHTAITEVPSYEEAEAEGRSWFGFVKQAYTNDAAPGVAGEGTRVYRDYTTAEEVMGQNDPRGGKLVAVTEDDITATSGDAIGQVKSEISSPSPRFTDPAREPEARKLWGEFVADNDPAKYRKAVQEGLRLTPTANHAEFVGDATAAEILPKSELPIRSDTIEFTTDAVDSAWNPKVTFSVNSETLLEDSNFIVSPTRFALERFDMHPRKETIAASLFEVKDPVWQQILDTQGWGALTASLAKLDETQLTEVFRNGKIKLRPSMSWTTRMSATRPIINIHTQLPAKEAKAALKRHAVIVPREAAIGGPAIAPINQSAHDAGPLMTAGFNVRPVSKPTDGTVGLHLGAGIGPEVAGAMKAWQTVAQRVLSGLGVKNNVHFIVVSSPSQLGAIRQDFEGTQWDNFERLVTPNDALMVPAKNGDVLMYVNTSAWTDLFAAYASAAHEFGHAVSYLALGAAPSKLQAQVFAAYRRYILTYRTGLHGKKLHEVLRSRAADSGLNESTVGAADEYNISFEEWFAEQVARWATTSVQPVGGAARLFRKIGRVIVNSLKMFQAKFPGVQAKAEPVIQEWLDAVYRGRPVWGERVQQSLIATTRAANAKHGIEVALQAESIKTHQVLEAHLGSDGNPPVNTPPVNMKKHTPGAIKAQVDNLWWLKKWGFGFKQLAQTYPDVKPLQLYAELMKMSRLEVNNIMAEAEEILKQQIRPLRRIKTGGKSQADRLADFLFDMTEMVYRTTDEVNRGVRRNPTQQEFTQLMRKHQLSDEAKQAYASLRDFFVKVVLRGEEVAIAEAQAVFANNPDQLKIAIATAKMMTSKLLNAPYFPMSRFGSWAVTVRTASGGIERFETYETKKEQQRALAEAGRQYPGSAGWSITASTLPEEAQAFSGMPPWFLDKLAKLPGSTPEQQEWIQLLRYQVSPARSFRKHLLPRKRIAGYSRDIERVFAKYAFQHARHYGRIKYQRALEAQIKSLRAEHVQKTPGVHDVNLLNKMADFLENHYNDVMNPKADWHTARSITSVWYLGFMPSSAALNMTQTLLMTWPQLGLRFGDVKASTALMKASADLTNYYKRGTYAGMTAGHFKMLDFLIKRGDITESMAAELAGLAAGNSLDSYMGFSDSAHRGWLAFADRAMLMFKLVEQWNRRVTARAAYELAMGDINNKAVQDVKKEFFLQYQQMTLEGFGSDSEILATLFAGKIIDNTQFDYSKEARPRFMRGRKGLLFAFYMFTQNTVFQLTHKQNRGLFTRYALIMLFLAGPMGLLPEEGEDILNFVARRFFGKQFDLAFEARKLVNDLMGTTKWTDSILHGAGRHGFGIPHMIEMMGGPEVPEVDFSRLVELRNLAPLPISKGLDMVDRGPKAEKAMSNFVRDIAGAGFGIPFNLSMALLDDELALTDIKRWERTMPRALKKASESLRRGWEGGERVGSNNYIMEYDKNSVADMAELAAHAMGFTSTRSAQAWDLSAAQREQSLFWASQRQALLNSAFQAKFYYKDSESWKRAREDIVEFNKTVPDPKLRISGDTIKRSFQSRRRSQQQFLKGDGPNVPPVLGRDIRKEFPEVRRVSERPVKTGE